MKAQQNNDSPARYRLLLFVADSEPNSLKAKNMIQDICDKYLKGNCDIEIIDTFTNYQSAIEHNVLVAPTLIVKAADTDIRIIGSLSDKSMLLNTLGISTVEDMKDEH